MNNISYKKLSVQDWIDVTPNPIQRDTERHAARAVHLRTPQPQHAFVFAAELPSGKLIKLDGHTRALMWERMEVARPSHVQVGIVPVENKADAERLYKTFDSKEALETMRDKVAGAFNRHNFHPESVLLQRGHFTISMRMAYAVLIGSTVWQGAAPTSKKRKDGSVATEALGEKIKSVDVYTLVDEFSGELNTLDGFMLANGQINGGQIGAFLISVRKYGAKVIPFWTGVFAKEGNKQGKAMDAIQATVEMIMRHPRSGGAQVSAELCARCLGGVEKYINDEVSTRIPSPIDTQGYLRGHEKPRERLIKAVDMRKKAA